MPATMTISTVSTSKIMRIGPMKLSWSRSTTFTGETIGSVTITPDGRRALLYTTATPVERLIVVDLDDAAARDTARRVLATNATRLYRL